jgi:hypothetical protein
MAFRRRPHLLPTTKNPGGGLEFRGAGHFAIGMRPRCLLQFVNGCRATMRFGSLARRSIGSLHNLSLSIAIFSIATLRCTDFKTRSSPNLKKL